MSAQEKKRLLEEESNGTDITLSNKAILEEFKNYKFPFENLILEGGGNKGVAYCGAYQVFEEVGITKQIRRICGTSAGAITACLMAVGFNAKEIKEFLDVDLQEIFLDHKCGYLSLLPNMLKSFGWNPGNRLLEWFGEQLRERTGNPDITFQEVLDIYGRELCIVVTNLNQMNTEYFHPKTTPKIPIRIAVRMSMSIPGLFGGYKHGQTPQTEDIYVDGGLLCNYPIHAFDGWWLSMNKKDSYFKKLQPLEDCSALLTKQERFGEWNPKTVGMLLYSTTETELMKSNLSKRLGNDTIPRPQTKLYKCRQKLREEERKATEEHQHIADALFRFMKVISLKGYDADDGVITVDELQQCFQDTTLFTKEDQKLLFGSNDAREAYKQLDKDLDEKITFNELLLFAEQKGVDIQTRFLGYKRKEVNSLSDFLVTLQTALAINVKRHFVEPRDIERTIGIDTDYIETTDFDLEAGDKDFLIQSGRKSAIAFLRYYCEKNFETKSKPI